MRLDHVSYATSQDQISHVINRIGSQIGTSFVDGGIHPKFGTRNFVAPLLNGQYIEVVCPINHPATDLTPFGTGVKKIANQGGGWFAWVISVNDINIFEKRLRRDSILGERLLPDGNKLQWKQIGVLETIEDNFRPFFIQWLSKEHPSINSGKIAQLKRIEITGDKKNIEDTYGFKLTEIEELAKIVIKPKQAQNYFNIEAVAFNVNGKEVIID
jgi:hypothetical protein